MLKTLHIADPSILISTVFEQMSNRITFDKCVWFLQLSQSTTDKRPSYDDILGANIEPTTFYNISDLEIQDNVARIW